MRIKKITFQTGFTVCSLSDLFTGIFIFLTLVSTSISSSSLFFRLRFVALFISGLLGFSQLLNKRVRNIRIIFFILLCLASWAISYVLRGAGAYDPNLFLYSFLYMGMGVNLVSHRHNIASAKYLFYFACGISLIRLIVLNEPIREFLKDGTSYNFISVLFLLFLSYYCIALVQNGTRIPYIPAFIFAWLSILVYGRGGILTGLFFLIAVVSLGLTDETDKHKRRLLILMTVITAIVGGIAAFLYIKKDNFALFQNIFAKFYVRSNEEEPRLQIWADYIKDCASSLGTLIFGADPPVLYDGNCHNAFLQMYASLGLIPLIIMLVCIIRLTIFAIRTQRMNLLCILLTLCLRSMTDKTAFQGYCEPLFYYMIFTWFNVKEKKKMISRDNHIIPDIWRGTVGKWALKNL